MSRIAETKRKITPLLKEVILDNILELNIHNCINRPPKKHIRIDEKVVDVLLGQVIWQHRITYS